MKKKSEDNWHNLSHVLHYNFVYFTLITNKYKMNLKTRKSSLGTHWRNYRFSQGLFLVWKLFIKWRLKIDNCTLPMYNPTYWNILIRKGKIQSLMMKQSFMNWCTLVKNKSQLGFSFLKQWIWIGILSTHYRNHRINLIKVQWCFQRWWI